ncbi:MAG: GTP-binding protein [Tumebacillaceae bacterium]
MTTPVPVYLLTGYLGAGKTTLLKTLLRHVKAQGLQPAVLMNEFGSESVDTLLLQGTNVPVVDMLEGCVCCTLKGTLPATLRQIIEGYAPDLLFLETTGVASPKELLKELQAPELDGLLTVAGVFTSVSAKRFPMDLTDEANMAINERTMLEQARHADALLLSKTDLVTEEKREALAALLRELNPQATLFTVTKGVVDPTALLASGHHKRETAARVTRDQREQEAHSKKAPTFARSKFGKVKPATQDARTSFGNLRTFTREFTAPVDAEKLVSFLQNLSADIVRVKGFYIDSTDGQLYEFHHVPPAPVEIAVQVVDHGKRFAVIIGENMDEEQLRAQLAACEG